MKIHRRNLPRCSYNTTVKFKFPGYSGDLNAYVKDNNSMIMLNYSSFCRFVLAMMRQRFSCRFNFPTQVEFEENMRPRIKDNLYNLSVLNDHTVEVKREAIDENAIETIIYSVFDDIVGYDIYIRIHNSIGDIKETMAPSQVKSIFEINGQSPKEVFVNPCDYFSASFITGKKEIQCIFYEGNIWYKFTDFNRMFGIQRTNLVTNKTNVDDFVVYDSFLYCNDNEVKDAIMNLDVSDEDKVKYLNAFEIKADVPEKHKEIVECEPCSGSLIRQEEQENITKDKPKKGRKRTVKMNIHEGKPNIIEENRMVTVVASVDKEVRDEAANLFSDLGLDMPTAIGIYLRQCVMRNGIPFEIKRGSMPEVIKQEVQDVHEENEVMEDNSSTIISAHEVEDNFTTAEAIKFTNVSRTKFVLLRELKGFPEIKEDGHYKYINKEDLKKWIADNHNLVYGKSVAELRSILNGEEIEENDLQELLDNRSTENDNLVAFTIDRDFIMQGRRPAIHEKDYTSAMGSEIFNVAHKKCVSLQDIVSNSYEFIRPVYKDYDITIVDRAKLKVDRDLSVEFIFVKDNNAAEHGIGGSLPYDYIFAKASDFINTIIDFENKGENGTRSYCSTIASISGINLIRVHSRNGKNTKFMQIKDIDKVFDYISNSETLKDNLKYDSTDLIKKVVLIELNEYVNKNRHNLKYRRRIIDYIDDFNRYYDDGVVNNMARHIFNDKTIKELLNSKDVGEFTYGNIIMAEAFRNLLVNYREGRKRNPDMPSAALKKPTNTSILMDVWDFINKSEYLTEVHEGFVRVSQSMEQRYNSLLKNYNDYVDEGKELDSIFDE